MSRNPNNRGRANRPECRRHINASSIIKVRAAQVYGSLAKFGIRAGLSRQLLHCRMRSAEVWNPNHGWWEYVLALPQGVLTSDAAAACDLLMELPPVPDAAAVDAIVAGQGEVWQECDVARGGWKQAQ